MALGDHVKAVIYSTLGTSLSAGVIAVILWLKGLSLHYALLVTAGFVLAVAIAAYLVSLIIVQFRKPKPTDQGTGDAYKEQPVANQHEACERTANNLESRMRMLQDQNITQGVQLAAYKKDAEKLKGEIEKEKTCSKALAAQLKEAQAEIAFLKKPKLTFEIDEAATQVHYIGGGGFPGGGAYRLAEANVKLRCLKIGEGLIGVRDLWASLCILDGRDEKVLLASEPFKVIYEFPSMHSVKMDDGWIIREPISNYRWFYFRFQIPTELDGALSRDHFFRVTIDVVGQEEPQSFAFYINSWSDAHNSNSRIKLRHEP